MGKDLLPRDIRDAYQVEERHHACSILKTDLPNQWQDLVEVLRLFKLKKSDMEKPGGNKSPIAKGLNGLFFERGWVEKSFEIKVTTDVVETLTPTHHVDYYKDRVAVETEWNNKDPFFDRDLTTFRLLFELNVLSVGVIITRADELQELFMELGKKTAAGAATTHMSKLIPKLDNRASGGCPVLALGITKRNMTLKPESILRYEHKFGTVLADPPWQFANRTGKVAPEHRRLHRYHTMKIDEICSLPVATLAADRSHLYLWCPNALLSWGLRVMEAWGFEYKTNIVWLKVRRDGGPDGRGVGFYYRNVTELVLFGTRGSMRTLKPGRRMVNIIATQKDKHSKKPDELYDMIEQCSPGPFLELFARKVRLGWVQLGDELPDDGSKHTIQPRPMQDGMIRPYRVPAKNQFMLIP